MELDRKEKTIEILLRMMEEKNEEDKNGMITAINEKIL